MPKVKLTGAILERLKAPVEGQIDYFDASYPGLSLRVSATGARSWVYFGRLHGKVRRVTLGKLRDVPLKDARKKAGEAAEKLREGDDPTAARREKRERMARDTIEAAVADWLKRDQAGNRTAGEVARLFEREVLPAWRGRPVTTITRRDCRDLIDGMAERAPTYARRLHSHLHRMFRWLAGRDVIEANPMADLPRPGRESPRDRVLSDAELARLWHACETAGYPFGPLVRLLLLTGARREEVTALRWAELGEDSIRLAADRTKMGEARIIPLSPEAQKIVAELPRIASPETGRAEFAFTTTGRTPVSGWSRAKQRLDTEAGKIGPDGTELAEPEPLPEWRIHDLRRTAATGLQRLGFRLEAIESVLGHLSGSRAGVVGVYQRHRFEDEARTALEAWAAHVTDLTEGRAANVVRLREADA